MADLLTSPPKPHPHATRLHVKCSDCVFYAGARLPDAAGPCASLGCERNRAPCLRFSPDVFSDAMGATLASKLVRDALNAVPDASAGALAAALVQVPRLRAAGFSLGQKVYFNAVGNSASRDYIANYYAGRVVMLDREGNLLIKGEKISATINLASVLTSNQWKAKREKLVKRKMIVDPKSPFTWERKDEKLLTNSKYRPPWLDKEIANYRANYLEAKNTRQTHDYDSVNPVKRGRGRPRKDGKPPVAKVKTTNLTAST